MKTTIFTIFILTGAVMAEDFPIDRAESTFQMSRYVSEVFASSLTNSPSWDAERSAPPMSPKRAAILARQSANEQLGNHKPWPQDQEGWDVWQVELVRSIHDEARWYYKVRVIPRISGSGGRNPVTLFVTFEGRVLPLTRKNEPKQ